ncbi:MAG: SdrD B-like domain-containing protein [Pseudonocardia sp.]
MALAATGCALAVPAVAAAAGITLDRSPSPPQAITPSQSEQISLQISWTSDPASFDLAARGPNSVLYPITSEGISGSLPGSLARTASFQPPAVFGRYTLLLNVNHSAGIESTATTIFDVADALGALRVEKYEDTDGDGTKDSDEAGLPSWAFNLVNPQGNGSTAVTGTEGFSRIDGVPAGNWTVAERAEAGWIATTPTSGTVNVPPNGLGTFAVGNVRPAPLSGTVFIDANRNGALDPGELPFPGARLDLTGTRGTGQTVPAKTTNADSRGEYDFADLLPGTYAVKVAKPGGWTLTTVQVRDRIQMRSNTPSPDHDFGLIRGGPTTTTTGVPTPTDIDIDKRGPATQRRNVPFNFTITVRNPSRFTARDVRLIDPVPDSMTLVERPKNVGLDNGVLTWNLGTIAPHRSKTVTMRVRIRPGVPAGFVRNTATVSVRGLPPESDTHRVRITEPPRPPRSGGVTG